MKKLGIALGVFFLLGGCATTDAPKSTPMVATDDAAALTPPGPDNSQNPTGTLSPLNTSANPWTNVNPQVQGQMRQGQIRGR